MITMTESYTLETATRFALQGRERRKTIGVMMDGKLRTVQVSGHRTPSGVRYNRLMRFYRRCLTRNAMRG